MKTLTLYNFYPKHLNLYGDNGNLQVLQRRCKWRGIDLTIMDVTGEKASISDADILCWGGGGDREQLLLSRELNRMRQTLQALIKDGAAGLAVCGGYQLLGQYYETLDGFKIPGVGLFDYHTKAEKKRLVGDVLVESGEFGRIIGFENHAGRTYHQGQPLGKVVQGFGNNGNDQLEGFRQGHFIGTYLHGPLLPKNPSLADQLILWALNRKYGDTRLSRLDDSHEELARKQAQAVMQKRRT